MEMDIPHLDEHQELALAMYRQRQSLLNQSWADAATLVSVEQRLRAHLFVLSHYIDEKEEEPSTEHQVFVYLARRMLADEEHNKVQGWGRAIDWLAEPGAKANAAKTALILLPPYDEHQQLLETAYRDVPELRPSIISIWQKTHQYIAAELIQRADILATDKGFQLAALDYAARSEQFKLNFFQTFYMPLVNGRGDTHQHLLESSIYGGLLRNDPNTKTAILRGIEQFPNTGTQLKLLRLAALTGDNEFLSVLDSLRASSPKIAFYLLALHGNKDAVPIIIDGLKNASQLEHAEQGWNLLTDVKLSQVPRMYLASDQDADDNQEDDDYDEIDAFNDEIFELDGEFEDEFSEDDESDTVPDVMVAEQWWNEHQEEWRQENRYLKGQIASAQVLATLAEQASGIITADLLDALALELRKPIPDYSESWLEHRQKFLKQHSQGEMAPSGTPLQNSQQQTTPQQLTQQRLRERNYA